MMSNIHRSLFVGDDQDAKEFWFCNPINVTIDLTGWNVERHMEEDNIATILNAIDLIKQCDEARIPTLVHCHAGIDRSPFVVACYLHEKLKRREHDNQDVYSYVKEKRPQTIIHDDWMKKFVVLSEVQRNE